MQSSHCRMKVNTALRDIPETNIKKIEPGFVEVLLHNSNRQEMVVKAIEEAGYSITGIASEIKNGNTLSFKTNINCSGCIAAVAPSLNSAEGIKEWKVDISDKDKILTVESNGITEEEIKTLINAKGFKIENN